MNKALLTHKKMAFTLAEVLITLGIIGIIAAITIPAILNTGSDKEFSAQAKGIFSILSQATLTLQNSDAINTALAGTNSEQDLMKSYANILSTSLIGTSGNSGSPGLFNTSYFAYNSSVSFTLDANTDNDKPAFLLTNGNVVGFQLFSTSCTNEFDFSGNAGPVCAVIWTDTNGKKGPNMWGKDCLWFWLIRQNGAYSVLPMGGRGGDPGQCNNNGTWSDSVGCTSYYIQNKPLP